MTRAALIVRGFFRRFLLEWGRTRPLRRMFQNWARMVRIYAHIMAQERAELQAEMAEVRKILQEKVHALAEQKRILDKHYLRQGAEQKLQRLQMLCGSVLRSRYRRLVLSGWRTWKAWLHNSLRASNAAGQAKMRTLQLRLATKVIMRMLQTLSETVHV